MIPSTKNQKAQIQIGEGSEITILSYNIHKGYTVGNRRFVLEGIKSALVEANADLVFLQEVVGENKKKQSLQLEWPEGSQFDYIAADVWEHVSYGKNAEYTHGHHGNALISKYPLEGIEHKNVSTNILERRGFIYARIGEQLPLHLINIHLDLLEKGRIKQLKKVCDYVEAKIPQDEPLIIAGDFNDWRRNASPLLEERLGVAEIHRQTEGKYAKTFPSFKPMLSLDRIYARSVTLKSAKVLKGGKWAKLSDHCGLIATIVL